MELSHIDGWVPDLVLTDAHDLAGVWVGSPIVTLNHSSFFIDIVLEQPKLHLVCRQKVYLKNSVD